jgi:hypothetical protein
VLSSDYSDVKIIGAGADAVDFALINLCHKGDIVVTQDYDVAFDMCLKLSGSIGKAVVVNGEDCYGSASEIRAYINAMIENGNEKATSEWIEWASKKADWYDPTLDVEDEYLGRREHGKNKEEKDLDKANVYMRRYW